jgi:hypothetical protein
MTMIWEICLTAFVFLIKFQIKGAEDPTSCENRLPAYMVIDNARLQSSIDRIFENVTEFDCTYTCSDNHLRDKEDQRVMCASFNYIHHNKTCFVYKDKSKPNGKKEIIEKSEHRYFEKFCLPDGSPLECGESSFFRADQMIINGFAINVTRTKRLDVCLQACLELNGLCKSVMFFYEVGECIINGGAAQDSEEGLVEEKNDKVVYVENGCILKDQIKSNNGNNKLAVEKEEEIVPKDSITTTEIPKKSSAKSRIVEQSTTQKSINVTDDEANFLIDEHKNDKKDGEKSDDKIKTSTQSVPINDEEKRKQEKEEEEQNEIVTVWSEWTECDRPDGRQVRRRVCRASSKACRGKLVESRSCEVTTVPPDDEDATTPTSKSKKITSSPSDSSPSGAWTVWSKKCQNFPTGQLCENGKKVGFQTRQCLGTPFECHGPFMRYCFVPC